MAPMSPHDDKSSAAPFAQAVGKKESRRLRAQRRGDRGIWFGLGMFGLVGWSVIVPTLAGLAIGLWIDATWPGRYSWTLMFLVAGVAIGCYNAWHWVVRERQLIEREEIDAENEPASVATQEGKDERT